MHKDNIFIAIMAGGVGSRFWPSSTEEKPKQFLDILGVGKSLLRMSFERSALIVKKENILIITNKKYKNLVAKDLPELPPQNILCEPSMNNTAPCIAYVALRISKKNPNAVFAVLPSDHVIMKENVYVEKLNSAFEFASSGDFIVTLGIQPNRPDTGYGYIKYAKKPYWNEIHNVLSFKEKPDLKTAQNYLDSAEYLWNAGMFIWSVPTILKAFEKHTTGILDTLSENSEVYGTEQEQEYIDKVYPLTKSISVDYAILEPADNVYTIPAEIGWSDLGTWNSLHAHLSGQNLEKSITIGSQIFTKDCPGTIVKSSIEKTIIIKGLKDYIVVEEDHALLIYPKDGEQDVKKIVNNIQAGNYPFGDKE
jgi:mannose-1-phosphate guanylyltransferase